MNGGVILKLPELKIGDKIAKMPIIQGGMAIRLSTGRLAAAVANQGGIGLIAASGMTNDELRYEIRMARALSKGIIGINIILFRNCGIMRPFRYGNKIIFEICKKIVALTPPGAAVIHMNNNTARSHQSELDIIIRGITGKAVGHYNGGIRTSYSLIRSQQITVEAAAAADYIKFEHFGRRTRFIRLIFNKRIF